MKEIVLEPPTRTTIQAALDDLNIEAAMRKLLAWTDKQRGNPMRRLEHVDEATKQLYRLLIYDMILALGEDDD